MVGDGISIQTTLSQLGNVARTQAKGQQAGQNAAPLEDQLDKNKEMKVDRVKETEKTEKGRVDPDGKKEKEKRRAKKPGERDGEDESRDDEELEEEATVSPEGLGMRIDTRA